MHMQAVYDSFTPYTQYSIATNNASRQFLRRDFDEGQINITVSYAAYRIIQSVFANRTAIVNSVATAYLKNNLGLDPMNLNTDANDPVGLGNVAAANIIAARMDDGANQLGDEVGTRQLNVPYADYTNYVAVNPAQVQAKYSNCSLLRSIDHWQPLLVPTAAGGVNTQGYLGAQLGNVKPFALPQAGYFRPIAPPLFADPRNKQHFLDNFTNVLNVSGSLGDMEKIIAEFWADGPTSTTPPGHWHQIAIDSAEKSNLNLMDTIQVLFLQANAAFDAGLAIWDAKRYYDSVRPISAIQCLFTGQQVKAWGGPYQGNILIDGGKWQPWQEKYFITPPFPEYPSGHSGFSAASATVLAAFFGDDTFRGKNYTIFAGHSVIEPAITNSSQSGFVDGVTNVPNTGPGTPGYSPATNISLSWPTYSAAAAQAAVSRLYGGIHTAFGNNIGISVGQKVGGMVFATSAALFNNQAYSTSSTGGQGFPTTSTSQSTNSNSGAAVVNNNDDDRHSISSGGIAGIVIGSVVFGLLIGGLIAALALAARKGRDNGRNDGVPLPEVRRSSMGLVQNQQSASNIATQPLGENTNRDLEDLRIANIKRSLDTVSHPNAV